MGKKISPILKNAKTNILIKTVLSILRVTFHRKWSSEKNLEYFIIILKAYQIFKRT